MNKSKIIDLLKALPSDTLKQFAKTIDKETVPYRLFRYLTTKSEKDIDKVDKMAKSVFKTSHANPKKDLHNEGHKLYNQLKEWLISQELKADKLAANQLFAQALKRHQISDWYTKALDQTESLLQQQGNEDMWLQFEYMRLAHQRYFQAGNDFSSADSATNFKSAYERLNAFYTLASLRYITEQRLRNRFLNEKNTLPREAEMLENTYKNKPLAQLYMLVSHLIETPDDDCFRNDFCPLLKESIHLADSENQGALITLWINYTIIRTQAGASDFMQDQYEGYRFATEHGYLESEGYLDTDHFLNAVVCGAIIEKYKDVEALIKQVSARLEGEAEKIQQLAHSLLYFYRKKFETAYKLLTKLDIRHLNAGLRIRLLKAQCLYELLAADSPTVDADDLQKHLEAYRHFLSRHDKIPTHDIESNGLFIQILKKITHCPKAEVYQILSDFLAKKPPVVAKSWLEGLLGTLK